MSFAETQAILRKILEKSDLSDEERFFLSGLNEMINNFIISIRYLSDNNSINLYTSQEELSQKIKENLILSCEETYLMLENLIQKLNTEILRVSTEKNEVSVYVRRLMTLQQGFIDALELMPKEENTVNNINNLDKDLFINGTVYNMISKRGGRYILGAQKVAPFRPKDVTGQCAGHVIRWAKDLERDQKHGHMSLDYTTAFFQINQWYYYSSFSPISSGNLLSQKDIQRISNALKSNTVYRLSLRETSNGGMRHAIGLRKEGDYIECFDPNFGYFFIPEKELPILISGLCMSYTSNKFYCNFDKFVLSPLGETSAPLEIKEKLKINPLTLDDFKQQFEKFDEEYAHVIDEKGFKERFLVFFEACLQRVENVDLQKIADLTNTAAFDFVDKFRNRSKHFDGAFWRKPQTDTRTALTKICEKALTEKTVQVQLRDQEEYVDESIPILNG